jgi:hypothetical protein
VATGLVKGELNTFGLDAELADAGCVAAVCFGVAPGLTGWGLLIGGLDFLLAKGLVGVEGRQPSDTRQKTTTTSENARNIQDSQQYWKPVNLSLTRKCGKINAMAGYCENRRNSSAPLAINCSATD